MPSGESSVDALGKIGKIAKIQSDIEENNQMAAANDAEIDKLVKSNKRSDSKRLMKLKEKQITLLRASVTLWDLKEFEMRLQMQQQLKETMRLQMQQQLKDKDDQMQQQLKEKEDTFLLILEGRFRSGG